MQKRENNQMFRPFIQEVKREMESEYMEFKIKMKLKRAYEDKRS